MKTNFTQEQKEKAASLILSYAKIGGDGMLNQTIDRLDFIINPQVTTFVTSTLTRDRVKSLIKDYTGGNGKHTLETTIDHIANALQNVLPGGPSLTFHPAIKAAQQAITPSLPKPIQANKYFLGTSRFSQKEIDILNLPHIDTVQDLKSVLEIIIDPRCIHKVDIKMDFYSNIAYYAEFTFICFSS